ncbi:oxygen-independent coproporphyrinogen III oxidase [Marinomonas sp. 15G1-11]|uniref:Coproporphyrinogen-III oxidase n=1 Tax=Marinomonas phaeophyticola TaxID=3004091 RepID=A0ABT4JQ77_9GAMM|nr:oxygen-independent coproporphyrinogen III oxidase [Marinomonas sp. 15G1-11]MCZ2720311.1 oxygen-independent coproporphyrinogen III oxidase [Marinomonas sp. 15G1-11]
MLWNTELIEKYNLSGPRYTSYPTAPQFSTEISKIALIEKMLTPSSKPLSLYFHIPFCAHLCYYCACNKIVTKQYDKGREYIELLEEELRLRSLMIQNDRPVTQLHFGGGTPTFLSCESIKTLFNTIHQYFNLLDDDSGDYSIEVDPREINLEKLTCLRKLGFNRLSLGIQDFDERVQKAIHRSQSVNLVSELLEQARDLGFRSINFDLIYGLPFQSVESFERTLDIVIEMSPDRLSIFNYAHLPERFPSQKRILDTSLPNASTKLAMLKRISERLSEAGYIHIGMDHFAKKSDSLTIAQKNKELKRNFQGYTTHDETDLIAFGTSAISNFNNTYTQNHVNLEMYQKAIENGQLPIVKGYISTEEDLVRQFVIMSLICHFELNLEELKLKFNVSFDSYFAKEIVELHKLEKDNIVKLDHNKLQVTDTGRLLIRCVCMIFDQYLNNGIRYSKVI